MNVPAMSIVAATLAAMSASSATAQTKSQQVVKPPLAQLWMDVATTTMPGMPDMGSIPGAGALGGLFGVRGVGEGNNTFGNTRGMLPGRYVDIALFTQRKPAGTEGLQSVPQVTGLAPTLPLVPPPPAARPDPTPSGSSRDPTEIERPKGRILFYWGCGETVRTGQPRVLDFARAAPQEWAGFMQGRAVSDRGAVAKPGHALWPNEKDRRSFGRDASLVGDHSVSGDGVPASLKFALSHANDFMPAIALTQSGTITDVLQLGWQPIGSARAYFINAIGGGGDGDTVFWSSAEVPEFGMGLIDFASPANVEQWLKEKVLLAPTVTQCAVPKGIFAKASGAMLRMIAYGSELNIAHPPRPTDVKQPWEPEWAVRVRTKSTAMTQLGTDAQRMGSGRDSPERAGAERAPPPAVEAKKDEQKAPSAVDVLRGILGR
jgi:hypothetical protein